MNNKREITRKKTVTANLGYVEFVWEDKWKKERDISRIEFITRSVMNTKRKAVYHNAQLYEVIKQCLPISCLQFGSFGETTLYIMRSLHIICFDP